MRGKRVEGKPAGPGKTRRASVGGQGEASVSKRSRPPGRFTHAPAQVRIIGGRWKRTPLAVADVPGLRPSPDRVRETLFNWLAHLVPDFSTLRGLDLFAGTGALGLEFASRGAAEVTLVESHSALSARLRQVAAKLAATTVNVVAGDALVFARATPDRSFDVVFLDPPFDTNMLLPALREAARLVAEDGYIYAESGAELDPAALEDCRLQAVRTGRAGQVRFSLLQRA